MLEQLLPYYERELAGLRELSGEFAQRYPKIAGRLSLDGEQSEDPHVERLIESFAFLAARIHRKIDDEFPQITEAFMQVLYPHYTQPFPSCTILQLETDPHKPEITARHTIPRHHPVLSPAIGGVQCRFRTCHEVHLYPLTLKAASIRLAQASEHLRRLAPRAAASIVLEFETQGGLPVAQIGLQRLRFFLDGDPVLAHLLYELLMVRTLGIHVSDGSDNSMHALHLPATALSPAGFAKEESLLEHDERSFDGYRLLSEYFAFPDKFLFIDLNGLDAAPLQHAGNRLRVEILLSSWSDSERHERLAQTISPNNFRLGCTPAVNLFKQAGEPIRLTHRKTTYPVVVDARRPLAYEVIAIDSVTGIERSGTQKQAREVPPFYALRHHAGAGDRSSFWYASRETSTRENDAGTEVELAFVDLDFTPRRPDLEVLSLNLLCSNRDLPASLPFGGNGLGTHTDFTLPQISIVKRARLLRKPTASLRPPVKRGLQWRLISHLSLNHLSLVASTDTLQEMLELYNPAQSQTVTRQIRGIAAVDAKPGVTRIAGSHFPMLVRGTDVTLTLDEQSFIGAGTVLFGSMIERFLALYCGPNSFTRLALRSKQQEQEIATWPARSGETPVI
jgi:type VI secretion system protein ImpG